MRSLDAARAAILARLRFIEIRIKQDPEAR
jgi:hypothetical protein